MPVRPRRFSISVILVATTFHLLSVGVVSAGRETLAEVLEAARQANPRLAAARASAAAGRAGVSVARAGWLPTVTAFADAGVATDPRAPTLAAGVGQRPAGFGATVSVPILDGGRTTSAVKAAGANASAERETARLTDQQVLLATVSAFANVRLSRRLVRLNRAAVGRLVATQEATVRRVAAKEATVADVAQAEAALAGARARHELLASQVAGAEAAFQALVQRRPGDLAPPPTVDGIVPATASEAIGEAVRAGPSVAVALYRQLAAEYAVARARAELMPTLSLEGRYSRRYDVPTIAEDPTGLSARAVVTVPLSASNIAAVDVAVHAHAAARLQAEDAKSEARRAATESFAQLVAKRAALGALRAQAAASRKALDGVSREAKVGQRTVFEVVTAQQTVLAAETALAEGERDLVLAGFGLLALVGRLEPAALAAPGAKPNRMTGPVGRPWRISVRKASRHDVPGVR
ncbi:MAG: TolC family protein [Hyphomicrobiaceae bacterium]